MVVDDDVFFKNPFEFQLATVIINDAIRREAIYILFKTEMGISEFCGLPIQDIDMKEVCNR